MNKLIKSILIGFAAVAVFAGCAKEEEGPVDPYSVNWTYILAPGVSTFNAIVSDAGEVIVPFDTLDLNVNQLRCTKPYAVSASFEIDESLVAAYNEANGTDCLFFEHASLINDHLSIEKGAYISADTLKVTYDIEGINSMLASVTSPTEYVLPITMTELKGDGQMSEKHIVYIVYKVVVLTAQQVDTPRGVLFTDWSKGTIKINGEVTTRLNDGSKYTDVYVGAGKTTIDVDFGMEIPLQTIEIVPYEWYYGWSRVEILLSDDGVKWESNGIYDFYQAYNYYITFYSDKVTRYVRIIGEGAIYDASWYPPYIGELQFFVAE